MDLDIINKWAKEIGLMSDTEFEENYKYIETLLNRRKQALRIHNVVGRSEQFYCTCSRAKGLDHGEEGTPYCISCQKEVQ
jgi:hypothetical protein